MPAPPPPAEEDEEEAPPRNGLERLICGALDDDDEGEEEEEGLSASDLDVLLGVLVLKFGLRAGSEALVAIFVLHITEFDHENSTIFW